MFCEEVQVNFNRAVLCAMKAESIKDESSIELYKESIRYVSKSVSVFEDMDLSSMYFETDYEYLSYLTSSIKYFDISIDVLCILMSTRRYDFIDVEVEIIAGSVLDLLNSVWAVYEKYYCVSTESVKQVSPILNDVSSFVNKVAHIVNGESSEFIDSVSSYAIEDIFKKYLYSTCVLYGSNKGVNPFSPSSTYFIDYAKFFKKRLVEPVESVAKCFCSSLMPVTYSGLSLVVSTLTTGEYIMQKDMLLKQGVV